MVSASVLGGAGALKTSHLSPRVPKTTLGGARETSGRIQHRGWAWDRDFTVFAFSELVTTACVSGL